VDLRRTDVLHPAQASLISTISSAKLLLREGESMRYLHSSSLGLAAAHIDEPFATLGKGSIYQN
jgi:hypothetical protein